MNFNLASILCIVLSMSACSSIPTAQIENFGEQSKELSSNIDVVINELYDSRINKEIEVAINQGDTVTTVDSLKVFDKHIFKTAKDRKTASLVKASKAINDYFSAIHQLALIGDKEKQALTGAKLASAVFSLNDANKALGSDDELISKEDAATLGKATGSISYLYAKNKAAKAIREIVITTDSAIQGLLKAMDTTLSSGYVKKQLYSYREEHLVSTLNDYKSAEAKMTMDKRREAVNVILEEYRWLKGTSEAIKNSRNSLKALGKAHAKLAKSLKDNEYTGSDIVAAIKTLKAESEYFDSVEEMFLDCESDTLEVKDNEGLVCKQDANANNSSNE